MKDFGSVTRLAEKFYLENPDKVLCHARCPNRPITKS